MLGDFYFIFIFLMCHYFVQVFYDGYVLLLMIVKTNIKIPDYWERDCD